MTVMIELVVALLCGWLTSEPIAAFAPVQIVTPSDPVVVDLSRRRRRTIVYGDGNPPPFGSWQPPPSEPSPAPASTTNNSGGWGGGMVSPTAAPTDGNPPPFSDWGMSTASPPAAPAATTSSSSFGIPPPMTSSGSSDSIVAGAGSDDPIASLIASQETAVESIAAAIPSLEVKPDLSWQSGEVIGTSPCTLDARDAPGPANVAWLANVQIPGLLSSLTIFNGPLTDIPHLLSRCYYNAAQNTIQLALDFQPRAYGAYETIDAHGNYPGPEELGRKAFEYSGARMDFNNKFANPNNLQTTWTELTRQLDGAVPTSIQPTELDLLTGSPMALSLTVPVTPSNVQIMIQLRQLAVETWLGWVTDPSGTNNHRPGAPINSQYVYDAKFRQNAYLALREYYTQILGAADGASLAAAESGPLDEAYVGGGS